MFCQSIALLNIRICDAVFKFDSDNGRVFFQIPKPNLRKISALVLDKKDSKVNGTILFILTYLANLNAWTTEYKIEAFK